MPKPLRIRTSVNGESTLSPGYFRAKWGGVCGVCGYSYDKDEICHYVGKHAAHETCHGVDGSDGLRHPTMQFDRNGHSVSPEPSYVVKGKRKPKLCGDCHLEHNGDCDE